MLFSINKTLSGRRVFLGHIVDASAMRHIHHTSIVSSLISPGPELIVQWDSNISCPDQRIKQ